MGVVEKLISITFWISNTFLIWEEKENAKTSKKNN